MYLAYIYVYTFCGAVYFAKCYRDLQATYIPQITPFNIQILLYLYIYFLTSFDQNVKVNLGRNILGIFNLKRVDMVLLAHRWKFNVAQFHKILN